MELGLITSGRANRACALNGTTSIASTSGHINRSTGRERVGGRPRGRRHKDAVATPLRQRPVVEDREQFEHPFTSGLLHRHLVDRERLEDQGVIRIRHRDRQRQPALDLVVPVDDVVNKSRHLGQFHLREETDVTEIHAQERQLQRIGPLCRSQD